MNRPRLNMPGAQAFALALLLSASSTAPGATPAPKMPWDPRIRPADFVAGVSHPYFPLVPGTRFRFVERGRRDTLDNEVEVTLETKRILGVTCVVVHDRVLAHGRVLEDTFDWYAQDRAGNVWYFGEDTREYDGEKTDTSGSWEAGVNGARPGIVMQARLTPGGAVPRGIRAGRGRRRRTDRRPRRQRFGRPRALRRVREDQGVVAARAGGRIQVVRTRCRHGAG